MTHQDVDRVQKIFNSRHADLMPTVATYLAYETSLSAEECLELMEVAKQSRDEYVARIEVERLAAVGLQKERAEQDSQLQ